MMRNLEKPLSDLYTYIKDADNINLRVSSVNVGWHIEHSLLVILKVIDSVCKSDPENYRRNLNLIRILVFYRNKFPRGKGRAPEIVVPKQREKTDFDALFSEARLSIEQLKKVHPNQFIKHPVFGNLNTKNTFIMLDIHTKHHIHIIKDIISIENIK